MDERTFTQWSYMAVFVGVVFTILGLQISPYNGMAPASDWLLSLMLVFLMLTTHEQMINARSRRARRLQAVFTLTVATFWGLLIAIAVWTVALILLLGWEKGLMISPILMLCMAAVFFYRFAPGVITRTAQRVELDRAPFQRLVLRTMFGTFLVAGVVQAISFLVYIRANPLPTAPVP